MWPALPYLQDRMWRPTGPRMVTMKRILCRGRKHLVSRCPKLLTRLLTNFKGTCKLMVELAGPTGKALNRVGLVPDQIRGLAGYVIQKCPGGGDTEHNLRSTTAGLGGYVTSGFLNIWNWMERSSLFLSPSRAGTNQFSGSRFDYITVTLQHPFQTSSRAGDTDINVADKVLGFTRQLWDSEDSQPHKKWYLQLGEKLEVKVAEMSPDREDVNWWEPVASDRIIKMNYKCLDSVAGPAVVDCAKLQYQGFGEGTIDLDAGETKYLNQDTCALAVSATKAVTLSWHQVSAAFETLFTFCVDHPLLLPKGGRASFGASPAFGVFGRKARRNEDVDITGLNALPDGLIINIWKHSGEPTNLPRELAAVLEGQQPPS
ncbi:MAG: hypothetical protein L6R38_004049 [Xanthoria sp. 2 TBL-2021]|nr:MAG: hypothetical protein L6R38_004049 [Xanthoria sp. 2 TBL-2021]